MYRIQIPLKVDYSIRTPRSSPWASLFDTLHLLLCLVMIGMVLVTAFQAQLECKVLSTRIFPSPLKIAK